MSTEGIVYQKINPLLETYKTRQDFPETGLRNKIYLAQDNKKSFIWNGSEYVGLGIEELNTDIFYKTYITEMKQFSNIY